MGGAEALERAPGELVDVLGPRGVAVDRQHVGAALGELGFDGRQLGVVDVGEHDVHPFGGEPLGECPADAAARAGDDGDLARQDVHAGAH